MVINRSVKSQSRVRGANKGRRRFLAIFKLEMTKPFVDADLLEAREVEEGKQSGLEKVIRSISERTGW